MATPATGSLESPLPANEVDEILDSIDALRADRSPYRAPVNRQATFIKCFGVFPVVDTAVPGAGGVSAHQEALSEDAILSTVPQSPSTSLLDAGSTPVSTSPERSEAFSLVGPFGRVVAQHESDPVQSNEDTVIDYALERFGSQGTFYVPAQTADEPGHLQTKDRQGPGTAQSPEGDSVVHPHAQASSSGDVVPRLPTPVHLSNDERFLMHHYTQRVVHLFGVLDNPKSPWKTIHLPRALQSVGEMAIGGSTSRIREALRSALLSISGFCLSNDNKLRGSHQLATKWANKATFFRGRAISLLKEAMETELYLTARPKYKEFLATMLSMISINVISGDTATCALHLDGVLKLVNHARTWKTKYSSKAQALHRIHFYLRIIHDSTAVRGRSDKMELSEREHYKVLIPEMPHCDLAQGGSSTSDGTRIPRLHQGITLEEESYEMIYGVPQSLLVLLSRAIHVIDDVLILRENFGSAAASPDHLVEQCAELETCIMDWKEDPVTRLGGTPSTSSTISTNSHIIKHMTRAFHNAIIIYFAQHIRLLDHRYLQSYVETVLESIETIEKIKAETKLLAAPLFWPAFIAASEAFTIDLQLRFKSWYDQVEMYGIEVARTGINVLLDVWKQGPPRGSRATSCWRTIMEGSNVTLMLT